MSPLCDMCPVCGKDLSSRYHETVAWTVSTITETYSTAEGIRSNESHRVNLRIKCRDGRNSQVWVEGKQEIFHNDMGDA